MMQALTINDINEMTSTWSSDNLKLLIDTLSQKLRAMTQVKAEPRNKVLQFPRIPSQLEMSQNVKDMVFWDFPKDIDIDKELENMWEERAK